MIIDIHSHMINQNFDINTFKHNFTTKMFFLRLQTKNYEQYYAKMSSQIETSKVDKAVICALEGALTCSDNKQSAKICAENTNFLFGANLNPYDDDIENKFKKVIDDNAVLIKILPSFQNIDLTDKRCYKFYELLKEYNIPLLVHTGIEHTIKGGNQEFNNPLMVENALREGVKVICAHLGARLNFWEKDYFENWCNLARKYENLYGDLSAMIWFYRKDYLKKLLKDKELCQKLLFGSDYPCYPYINLKKDANIFDDWYDMFKKIGFDESIFLRVQTILRLNKSA